MTTTGYEVAARQAKAEKMAHLLANRYGADAATAAALPAKHRRIVAELAGCRPPSDATWEVVIDCLSGMEALGPVSSTEELRQRMEVGVLSSYEAEYEARRLADLRADLARVAADVPPEPTCEECGEALVDHQPVKLSRYSEATDRLCGRCAFTA